MSIHQRFKAALQALGIAPDVKAALALSGGPDSLALAILASTWLSEGDDHEHLALQCVPAMHRTLPMNEPHST
jgi:tRNA(Ile)-lysidine synthase TilS/MesJ